MEYLKAFRRGFGCLRIFLCTFNLLPVSKKLGRILGQTLINRNGLIGFERLPTENMRRVIIENSHFCTMEGVAKIIND